MTQTEQPASFGAAPPPETLGEPASASNGSVQESPPAAAQASPGSQKKRSLLRRGFNWFWRGQELKAVRREGTSEQARKYEERARTAAELGRRALEPVEPLRRLNAEAPACDLYAQSVFWSLKALSVSSFASRDSATSNEHDRDSVAASRELWTKVDAELLTRAAGDEESLARLQTTIDSGSFVERAEFPKEEQARLAGALRKFAEALLSELELPKRTVDLLLIQRAFRLGLLFMFGVSVAGGVIATRNYMDARNDLAVGKPWKASSLYVAPGCPSPSQSCPESPNYFVHTREENQPWLELDLGQVQKISSVRVENRKECCFERAAPLVVEVSTDGKQWRQVARRETRFNTWRAQFETTDARYVRLRIAKRGILHFARVRILP